jgi:uncharacterized protein YkwD
MREPQQVTADQPSRPEPFASGRAPRTTRRRTSAAFAVLTVVAAVLTGLLTAAPAQAATSSTSTERAFVSGINAARRASHRPQLSMSSQLTAVARSWAGSMARSNRLAHNPRVTAQVRSWRYLGENVGVGSTTSSLHQAFMGSAPHRANVLSSRYTRVGVGVAYGQGRMWVVEVFERPSGHVSRTSSRTTRTIGYGSRGATVARLQRKLHVRPTGYFGPVTRAKVKAYQKRHHLRVSGRLDRPTRHRLGL